MAANRQEKLICRAESLARDTFEILTLTGDGSPEWTATLQKQFRTFTILAMQQFESLKGRLTNWQNQVRCGEVEFTPEREDDFKAALDASVSFLSFLIDKFDSHRQGGLFLVKSRRVGLMDSHRKEAQKILTSWRSPEWETRHERSVEWNEEQTAYLRKRLGSCS
ncbi:MAG: hypothetical protein JNM56_29065 [Planctomycetia bacterium]|nr:hypothetical protein [Planctomycetia bacterium]